MSKAADPYLVSRTDCSLALSTSWRTMQFWIMRGCPVKQKGTRGTPWIFDLEAVVLWAIRRRLIRKRISLPCTECGKWQHRLRPRGPLDKIDRARIVCSACRSAEPIDELDIDDEL